MSFQKIDPANTAPSLDPKMVMVYGYTDDELKNVVEFLETGELPYRTITSDLTGLTIEQLLHNEAVSSKPEKLFAQRVMVLGGFSEQLLHQFLANLKQTSFKRPIIATITPTSMKWTFAHLVKELTLEHMEMQRHRSLKK